MTKSHIDAIGISTGTETIQFVKHYQKNRIDVLSAVRGTWIWRSGGALISLAIKAHDELHNLKNISHPIDSILQFFPVACASATQCSIHQLGNATSYNLLAMDSFSIRWYSAERMKWADTTDCS